MKRLLLFTLLAFVLSCQNDSPSSTQPNQPIIPDSNVIKKEAVNPYVAIDISPIDMAYFPADYPIQKMNDSAKTSPVARVIYSRPHRQNRQIFGSLLKWGQPWRLGANEATEIQFFQPVTIQKKRIEKGQYVLYAIPYEDHWTIVFNTNLYSWGLKFNPAKDIAKFDIPSTTKNQQVEYFSMLFEKTATGADLVMAWEAVEARLPIQF